MQSKSRALLVVAAFGVAVSATFLQPAAKPPGDALASTVRQTPETPSDADKGQFTGLAQLRNERVAALSDDVESAAAFTPTDNADLLPGQCEHYATLFASTPMKWTSADWSLVQATGAGADLPRPFASTIDTEDPFACTLGIAAATGNYLVRQRSTLWETEISLDCGDEQSEAGDLAIPPTWPLNIYVLDANGKSIEDVQVSVLRGAPEENFSTTAAPGAGGAFSASVVPGSFTVAVQGASLRPIFQSVEVGNGPMDVIVDVPSGDRFEVSFQFKRNGETVKVSRAELQDVQALDAGHNDALIARGGRHRAGRSTKAEINDMKRALKVNDEEALRDYLSGYEVVSLVLNSTDEVTVRALGMDIQVDPGRAGSVIEVDIP